MAKFNKQQVLAKITETGMVPVFYNNDVEIAKNIVKACYDGGVRAFEFTNRGDFAHEVFAEEDMMAKMMEGMTIAPPTKMAFLRA